MSNIKQRLKLLAGKGFSKSLAYYQRQASILGEGFQLVEVDELNAKLRINICEGCPAKKFDPEKRQCTVCGCGMDFKTTLKYEPFSGLLDDSKKEKIKCPLGYW